MVRRRQAGLTTVVRILLAGATGLVGSLVLARLLDDDRVSRVVALTRRPLAPHPRLCNPIVDAATLPPDAEWWSVDGAIGTLGTTRAQSPSAAAYRAIDHDYPLAIAARVRAAGAQRFALVTSMGAHPRSWFRYTRIKGELEAAIDRLGFASLTIVRPGFLVGERTATRPYEQATTTLLLRLDRLLPDVARPTPATTVAALLVDRLLAGAPGRCVIGQTAILRHARGTS